MDKAEAKALTEAVKSLDKTVGRLVTQLETLNKREDAVGDRLKLIADKLGDVVQRLQHGATATVQSAN